MDFNNLPKPTGFEGDTGVSPVFKNNVIVSEFGSETVTYIKNKEFSKDEIYEKLNKQELRSDLKNNKSGIESIEKNTDYIKFERCVLISKKIFKFEKGIDIEDKYNELKRCTFYVFDNFIGAIGDAKAIKNTVEFISDVMQYQFTFFNVSEMLMFHISDRFETLENVSINRIKHPNIKKMNISGKANDISDLDVKFSGYDVASVSGVIYTGVDKRRIKINKIGKITFNKAKDKPIYVKHIKFGFELLNNEI